MVPYLRASRSTTSFHVVARPDGRSSRYRDRRGPSAVPESAGILRTDTPPVRLRSVAGGARTVIRPTVVAARPSSPPSRLRPRDRRGAPVDRGDGRRYAVGRRADRRHGRPRGRGNRLGRPAARRRLGPGRREGRAVVLPERDGVLPNGVAGPRPGREPGRDRRRRGRRLAGPGRRHPRQGHCGPARGVHVAVRLRGGRGPPETARVDSPSIRLAGDLRETSGVASVSIATRTPTPTRAPPVGTGEATWSTTRRPRSPGGCFSDWGETGSRCCSATGWGRSAGTPSRWWFATATHRTSGSSGSNASPTAPGCGSPASLATT